MRILVAAILVGALGAAGCASQKPAAQAFSELPSAAPTHATLPPSMNARLIVTPENGLAGKVVRANAVGRFVVLNFPIGHLPQLEQPLEVYRRGLKVGELKVTGPQNDDSIIADILTGDAAPGDDVRDK